MARSKKVTLKNVSGGSASIVIDGKLKKFSFADVTIDITMDQLWDVYNDRGGRVMLEEDIIRVMQADARQEIGLPELDEYMIDGEGFKVLFTKPLEKVEDFLSYCSDAMLERAVDEAISQNVSDTRIRQLIEDYSGKKLAPILEEKIEKEKDNPKEKPVAEGEKPKPRRGRKPKAKTTE